jgi:hypothetical protein
LSQARTRSTADADGDGCRSPAAVSNPLLLAAALPLLDGGTGSLGSSTAAEAGGDDTARDGIDVDAASTTAGAVIDDGTAVVDDAPDGADDGRTGAASLVASVAAPRSGTTADTMTSLSSDEAPTAALDRTGDGRSTAIDSTVPSAVSGDDGRAAGAAVDAAVGADDAADAANTGTEAATPARLEAADAAAWPGDRTGDTTPEADGDVGDA